MTPVYEGGTSFGSGDLWIAVHRHCPRDVESNIWYDELVNEKAIPLRSINYLFFSNPSTPSLPSFHRLYSHTTNKNLPSIDV